MIAKNKERLHQRKTQICRQIGILRAEEPKLVLERKEMQNLVVGRIQNTKRCAGWGECFLPIRTIFVDAGLRIHYPSRQYKGAKLPYRQRVKHKSKYIDFENTLIHELVHYRFPQLGHGKKFEERIKEIRRGRTFEPKHICLFAHYRKKYRQDIDGPNDIFLEDTSKDIDELDDIVKAVERKERN